jgi:hypothetical protein
VSDLLTLDDVRNRFPPTADGYRPSERFLRDTVRHLGCYIQVGRVIYLTEEHWTQLLIGLQPQQHGPLSGSRKRGTKLSFSNKGLENELELNLLSHKFENRDCLRRLPED